MIMKEEERDPNIIIYHRLCAHLAISLDDRDYQVHQHFSEDHAYSHKLGYMHTIKRIDEKQSVKLNILFKPICNNNAAFKEVVPLVKLHVHCLTAN